MIITLDLGTTSNRCLAITQDGQCVALAQEEFSQLFPKPAWVEHDADEIWRSTHSVLTKVLDQVDLNSVTALAVTNQRETTIAWHRQTGKPFANAIVWQCRRTSDRINSLHEVTKSEIRSKTGLLPDAYFSASKMQWLADHCPEIKQALSEGNCCFGTVDTWIIWQLTKGQSYVTDSSNASRTMLYNIHTLDFDDDLLDLFQIPPHALPEVLDSNACFGYTSEELTQKPFPIHAVMGDQQSSLFAQCGSNEDLLKNTYGTGLFICSNTGSEIVDSDVLLSTVAWTINGKTEYAVEGSVFIGGAIIQWLRDQLQLFSNASESEALALSLPSNEGVYCVPALAGLAAPHWDSSARGLFIGLDRGTGKAHMVRAALESMAYQTYDVVQHIKNLKHDQPLSALLVDGGATENQFLMQFQADVLGIPLLKSTIKESTAYGVAGLAGLSTGLFSESTYRSFFEVDKQYEAQGDDDQMNQYILQWKKAVERAKQWAI